MKNVEQMEKWYNDIIISSLKSNVELLQRERNAYRKTLEEIAKQDPLLVGCSHKSPCDNSCALLYSAQLKKKKHRSVGCAKALAQRVMDYFDGKEGTIKE